MDRFVTSRSGRTLDVMFPAVPLLRLGLFRVLLCGFAFLDVLIFSSYVRRYADVDPLFFDPVFLLRLPDILGFDVHPVPGSGAHLGMTVVLLLALAAATAGRWTRAALAVAAPLYLYHWVLFNSWGKVNHGRIPVIIALLVLVLAPAGARFSLDRLRASPADDPDYDRLAGWALRLIGMVLVLAYLLSVLAKLMNSGIGWPLQPILQLHLRFAGNPVSEFLSHLPWVIVVAQFVTLAAESLSILALTGGWRRNIVLFTLAGFHISSYFLIGTEFFGYLICYAAFFRLEHGWAWLQGRFGPSRAHAHPKVLSATTNGRPLDS